MWFAYETTRGAADGKIFGIKFPLQVQARRNIDRSLFFGNDPNVVLQQHFWKVDGALVGQGRLADVLHPLHLRSDRDGRVVGHLASPVGHGS